MSVLKINTLGCHPMLLLKKMEAAGGITVLAEEKRTFSDVDYPYRIVAQIGEGMYLEAHDFIHEAATEESELPSYSKTYVATPHSRPQLEGVEADKTALAHGTYADSYGGEFYVTVPDIGSWAEANFSVLYAWPIQVAAAYHGGLLNNAYALNDGVSDALMAVAAIPDTATLQEACTDSTYANVRVWMEGEKDYPGWPFVIAASDVGCFIDESTHMIKSRDNAATTTLYPTPNIVSATRIRIAGNVDESNDLVSPSDWHPLPIFAAITATDSGLFFEIGPAGSRGGIFAIVSIDTSRGNGFNEGSCLAMYKNYPVALFSGGSRPPREKLLVYGSPGDTTATKTMSAYIATPPVNSDVVVGGPVVSEVYAFDSDEIRGAVQGVLGIAETVDVGTMGWLDGNRYRVLIPGRMTQVG